MPYTKEKYQEVGKAARERMARLSPAERKALTTRANEARSRKARERRHAAWVAELRGHGYVVIHPDTRANMDERDWSAIGRWDDNPFNANAGSQEDTEAS